MFKIFPSLISGQILNLEQEIKKLEPYCDGFHLDVMDFNFVPNLTFGPMFINQIAKVTTKQLFVHLMVNNPASWVDILELKKEDIFCFHYEAIKEHRKLIDLIHKKNWLASVALKPQTNIETIFSFSKELDQVLLMSVEPGFSGQQFIPSILKKLDDLSQYRAQYNLQFTIAIDGGVNLDNVIKLAQNGANDFAIASAIFKNKNPINELEKFNDLLKR